MLQHPSGSCDAKKLVSASDFMYRANLFDLLVATAQEQLYHSVWQRLREGRGVDHMFVVPRSICLHQFPSNTSPTSSAWEVYDMNLAGCLLCGDMHVCRVGFFVL